MPIIVNVNTATPGASIRRETLNGREVVIVPAKTLPYDIVMNGIKYPREVIEKAHKGLEKSLAPLNHPIVNGRHISAFDPEGLSQGYFGAWNANVRLENNRVAFDKYIDVARAQESESGRRVMAAIEAAEANGTAIHTSTGMFVTKKAAPEGLDHKWIAEDMIMDHDAILLDEPGAGTPEQGVGMLVNSAGVSEEVDVVNSSITEEDFNAASYGIREAFEDLARVEQRRVFDGKIAQVLSYMKDLMKGNDTGAASLETNTEEGDEMTVTKQDLDALALKVDALATNVEKLQGADGLAAIVTNALKPVTEKLENLEAADKEREKEERTKLTETVVNSNMFTREDCDGFTVNQLRTLADKTMPKNAAGVVQGSFVTNGQKDEWQGYDMNAHMDDDKGAQA